MHLRRGGDAPVLGNARVDARELRERDERDDGVRAAEGVEHRVLRAREEEEEEEDVAIAREDGAWGDVGVWFDGSAREYERAEARAPVMDLLL